MKAHELEATMSEAKRFLRAAEDLLARARAEQDSRIPSCFGYITLDDAINNDCARERGAVRRASLDLTRQLSVLRKPG